MAIKSDTAALARQIRTLEPDRWRFEIEHVTGSIADFFADPDAEGFQLQLWLDRQHMPEHIAEQARTAAANPPVWPRVMFFYVPTPDRTPEPDDGRTVTISGMAENLPDRDVSTATIRLTGSRTPK